MRMKDKRYLVAFTLFSVFDALTTWFGVERGLVEVNPVLAARLSDALTFFGSYAVFTSIGLVLLFLALRLKALFDTFGYFAKAFVFLKALPAINNLTVLMGIPLYSLVLTGVSRLLGFF